MTCTMKAHVQRAQCEAALAGDGKNGVPNVEVHELTVGPSPSPERPLVVAQVAAATFGWRIATW